MGPASKRAKTAPPSSGAAASPLSLYKQAVKLVRQQPCGDTSCDALIAEKLQKAIDALSSNINEGHIVEHSLDLDLEDEVAFLLASCHMQLGLLHRRQDKVEAAEQQLRSSLQYFPKFVAAHSALGQVLKYAAASTEQLQQAESHLQEAIAISEQLSAAEDGLLVDGNKACASELEAADAARSALAMLLCQSGRDEEAVPHLTALGFKFRLSREVLHYALPSSRPPAEVYTEATRASNGGSSTTGSSGEFPLQVVDNALPQELLQHLQDAFAPAAPFWPEHSYGRVGYFSYMFRMDDPVSSSMHQVAHHLHKLAMKYFPAAVEAQYAEFWAHCRRHSSGHQLHYDSDDEGQGGVRNPIFTSVLYLSPHTSSSNSSQDGAGSHGTAGAAAEARQPFVGGPTLMTNQVLGGPLATDGWLAFPAVNRFTMFDGKYLHGVIPGRGATPAEDGRRCTLMFAFWKDLKCRTPPAKGVGACMLMPSSAETSRQWVHMLQPREGGWGSCEPVPLPKPQPVSAVWEPISGSTSSLAGASYDACFQGF